VDPSRESRPIMILDATKGHGPEVKWPGEDRWTPTGARNDRSFTVIGGEFTRAEGRPFAD